jgi:hypothetical protein
MIRVKRPDGSWDDIPGGSVPFYEQGGPLHVQAVPEPVFYAPESWLAFEVLADPGHGTVAGVEEVVFPEGFV